ncbi:MAG: hypothetical protein COY40_04565 [Alphaproteobacteria bacterium CG_4_10_14_0_8_um_filter_53_9]|nr:MAG: hypothetical protein COY40_04565 [Alphaproteobacteria bacterium CG_4_10_14_0_8_um_filter_53_9]
MTQILLPLALLNKEDLQTLITRSLSLTADQYEPKKLPSLVKRLLALAPPAEKDVCKTRALLAATSGNVPLWRLIRNSFNPYVYRSIMESYYSDIRTAAAKSGNVEMWHAVKKDKPIGYIALWVYYAEAALQSENPHMLFTVLEESPGEKLEYWTREEWEKQPPESMAEVIKAFRKKRRFSSL